MNSNELDNNVKIGEDYLIQIVNGDGINPRVRRYGDEDSILEIRYDEEDKSILSVECILSISIDLMDYEMPAYKELEKKTSAKLLFDDNKKMPYFRIIFDRNNLNIAIKNKKIINSYYTSGRVDYYFDNDNNLCNIRVRDLTDKEYFILKDEMYQTGYYLIRNHRTR